MNTSLGLLGTIHGYRSVPPPGVSGVRGSKMHPSGAIIASNSRPAIQYFRIALILLELERKLRIGLPVFLALGRDVGAVVPHVRDVER